MSGCTFTDSSPASTVFDIDSGTSLTVVASPVVRHPASRLAVVETTGALTIDGRSVRSS